MKAKKKEQPKEKEKLHPRNQHKERYDFVALIKSCSELGEFVKPNIHGDDSIDFANPDAVKWLNKAILKHYYGINYWDIPENYLCPPIPGRADYIHHISDLLRTSNYGKIPTGQKVKCVDIGVGANCVYPIIGIKEYDWSFIGSDVDPISIESAQKIIDSNENLQSKIELRLQPAKNDVFRNILNEDELIDVTICNPPFHSSLEEATKGTNRKIKNLSDKKPTKTVLNFGGQNAELFCEGGEERFIGTMIRQSRQFRNSCFWFSSLVSKQSSLKSIQEALKKAEVEETITIPMGQGNKTSRIVAWTFLTKEQQKIWKNTKWNAKF
ncbi:MAG: 23S rRNA (adenine(1618)-N(6))-methyltransferase RlmF [Fluviicola sp.]|jgi:23S rRNA (adenine1618-N6)-methyltransferase|nr:23S rRNA (adenine(1618)-N(6))-methyltransferase RlmF [Fluviicola sp.]